jgi:hypothetical protein
MTTYQQEGRGYESTYKNRLTAPRVQGDKKIPQIPVEVLEARARVEAIKRAKRTPTARKLTDLTIGTVF